MIISYFWVLGSPYHATSADMKHLPVRPIKAYIFDLCNNHSDFQRFAMNLLNIAFEQTIEDEILQELESYPADYFHDSRSQNRIVYGLCGFWIGLLNKSLKKHDKFRKVCTYQTPCSICQSLATYSWHLINIHRKQSFTPKAYGYYSQSWFDPFIYINKNGVAYDQLIAQVEYLLGAKFPSFFVKLLETNFQNRYVQLNIGISQFQIMTLFPKYQKYSLTGVLKTSSAITEKLNKIGEYDGSVIIPFAASIKGCDQYLCFKAEKAGTSDGKVYLAKDGFFQVADSFEDLVKLPEDLIAIFSNSNEDKIVLQERNASLADLLSVSHIENWK